MNRRTIIEYVVLAILLFVLSIVLVIYFSPTAKTFFFGKIANSIELSKFPTSTSPTPSPRPIPHGKTGFTVGQGDKTVPQFRRGFIDPYDPTKGETQTVTISVTHSSPVKKVIATLKTDHGTSDPFPFTLVSGTNTNGQWQGSWTIVDTYLYTYKLSLTAEGVDGKPAKVVVTLR